MALLDLLLRLRETLALSLYVAHFEHGIRGEASREDARYVAAFCRARGISCTVEAASVLKYAKEQHLSVETAARKLRYAFLRRVKDCVGAQVIAVAHHADDQAETVLQHILRGAGLNGMTAMLPHTGDVVRPLLCCSKAELIAYCKAHSIEVRHDATNDVADARRNYLRLEIMPRLRAHIHPAVSTTLVRLADIVRADNALLDELAQIAFSRVLHSKKMTKSKEHVAHLALSRAAFRAEPLALQRRIVRLAMCNFVAESHDWGYRQVEQVRRMMIGTDDGLWWDLPGHVRFSLVKKCGVFIYSPVRSVHKGDDTKLTMVDNAVQLKVPGVTNLPLLGITLIADIVKTRKLTDGRREIYCAAHALKNAYVRTRRAGDRVQFAHGTKKLKDFFIDERVPRDVRDRIPLLVLEEGIVWAVGVRRFLPAMVEKDEPIMRFVAVFEKGAYDHAQRFREDPFR